MDISPCGSLAMWIPGHVDLCPCGSLATWISGYVNLWPCESLSMWISGHVDLWPRESLAYTRIVKKNLIICLPGQYCNQYLCSVFVWYSTGSDDDDGSGGGCILSRRKIWYFLDRFFFFGLRLVRCWASNFFFLSWTRKCPWSISADVLFQRLWIRSMNRVILSSQGLMRKETLSSLFLLEQQSLPCSSGYSLSSFSGLLNG